MSYATQGDLVERYGADELVRLTDRTNKPASTIDASVVQSQLDSADATINGYVQAAGLTVPLAPAPRSIIDAACKIARYLLWKDKASDRVRQDYEDAIAWLLNLSRGLVQLGDTAAPAQTTTAGAPIVVSGGGRTFTRRKLKGF